MASITLIIAISALIFALLSLAKMRLLEKRITLNEANMQFIKDLLNDINNKVTKIDIHTTDNYNNNWYHIYYLDNY